jgi:uncharacterized membrane protein YeaQ/YmgE (transglycosylase-associated protein family)
MIHLAPSPCRVSGHALASAPYRSKETDIEINGIIMAIIVGAIVGGLGRLVIRGKQNISMLMTIVIGIVAALIGTFIARQLHVSNTAGIDWIQLFIQVALAAVGVTLYTGGGRGRGRSRRR